MIITWNMLEGKVGTTANGWEFGVGKYIRITDVYHRTRIVVSSVMQTAITVHTG